MLGKLWCQESGPVAWSRWSVGWVVALSAEPGGVHGGQPMELLWVGCLELPGINGQSRYWPFSIRAKAWISRFMLPCSMSQEKCYGALIEHLPYVIRLFYKCSRGLRPYRIRRPTPFNPLDIIRPEPFKRL